MGTRTGAIDAGEPPLILCYHAVSSVWPSALAVTADLLSEHVEYLSRRGYVGLTLSESERRRHDGTLPSRAVVVTFDDAFASILDARPILERVGFPATVFVVTRFAHDGSRLSWPELAPSAMTFGAELESLSWDRLEKLVAAGWEVGSHTVSHPWLPRVSDDQLAFELSQSKATIAARLGGCDTVAYPFGAADQRVADAARRAGYLAGCTLSRFHTIDERLRRPRIGMFPGDVTWRSRLKLSRNIRRVRRLGFLANGSGRAVAYAERRRIVVAGADTISGLAVVRGLRAGGYEPWVATNGRRSYAAKTRSAAGSIHVPDEGAEPELHAASIAAACGHLAAAAVLPCTERALLALAGRTGLFRTETAVGVPGREHVLRATDKTALGELAARAGLRVPVTIEHRSGQTLPDGMEFPLVVKPLRSELQVGNGVRHETAMVVRSRAELESRSERLGGRVLVQQRIDGALRAAVGVAWCGELVCVGFQRSLRIWPPDCGTTAYGVSDVPDPVLERGIRGIAAQLGWSGMLQLQFLGDGDETVLIDVNPRPYTSLSLSIGAGLNLPAIWADLLTGRTPRIGRWRAGVRYRAEELDVRAWPRAILDRTSVPVDPSLLAREGGTVNSVIRLTDPAPLTVSLAKLAAGLRRQ